jgi:hypothetical protein
VLILDLKYFTESPLTEFLNLLVIVHGGGAFLTGRNTRSYGDFFWILGQVKGLVDNVLRVSLTQCFDFPIPVDSLSPVQEFSFEATLCARNQSLKVDRSLVPSGYTSAGVLIARTFDFIRTIWCFFI